jgi:hypothetical protein
MCAAHTMRCDPKASLPLPLSLTELIWRHLQPLYALFMQPTDFGVLDCY